MLKLVLFVKVAVSSQQMAIIPFERVYDILISGCTININYDGGELLETADSYQKKVSTVRYICDSDDAANKIARQFYKALNKNLKAFYFGEQED